MNQETAIKRAHVALMKHPETALYSGVILMGESSVVDAKFTAYTDGLNKRYSRWFLDTIDKESKKRGLVLHENLHIALKQTIFGKAMFKENPKMANLAADFVVNDVIENIKGTIGGTNERIVELPDGAVYDEMFHDWSMRKVYDYLKKNAKGGNGGKRGQGKGKGSEPPSGGTQNNDDDGDGDGDELDGDAEQSVGEKGKPSGDGDEGQTKKQSRDEDGEDDGGEYDGQLERFKDSQVSSKDQFEPECSTDKAFRQNEDKLLDEK